MELLEGIETRRSTRAFNPTPVPRETIEKILKTAKQSPSFSDSQPWEVAVVTGKKKEELSKTLRELGESDVTPNPDLPLPTTWPSKNEKIVKAHGAKRFETLGIGREDKQKRKELLLSNFEFYGAPCGLFLFMDKSLTSWSIFDMGLFAQSIILTAHSFGLGCCLQAVLAFYPDAVRRIMGIPETKLLVLGISMGYPDPNAVLNTYKSARVGLDEFVQWHTQ